MTVAVVPDVVTVGVMKKTSLPDALATDAAAAVGADVPYFTVTLPFPRFGAVRSERLFDTLPSNLNVHIASPDVLQRV